MLGSSPADWHSGAAAQVELVAGRAVLLLRRFDRRGAERIPFLTAMSMVSAVDNDAYSYAKTYSHAKTYSNSGAGSCLGC